MAGRRRTSRRIAGLALSVTVAWAGVAGPLSVEARADASSPEARTIARALALLPTPIEVPVVPIDPELSAHPAALRRLDAFIVTDDDGRLRPVIYVNARADIVRRAMKGSRLFLAVLASVLHHEHQHLQGRDERSARHAERLMFEALMARGDVDRREGARYLRALEQQPLPAPSGVVLPRP
jgi:hypothetical protein